MEDTTDMAVTDADTDMDSVISARGPLMPNPRLKQLLLPNPRLKPLLMLTTDTTAVDTDTDTVMVSVIAVDTTDMADTPMADMLMLITTARGLLMLTPRLMPLLMLTMDTTAVDTDTDTDTVMAVVTMDMADTAVTTVRFNRILACRSKNLFHNHIHPATN